MCAAAGQASFKVNGVSLAEAEALVLAAEYGKLIADIKVCQRCQETALLLGAEFESITVRAAAAAQVVLEGSAEPGKPVTKSVDEYVAAYSAAFVSDFSKVRPCMRTSAHLEQMQSLCSASGGYPA